MLAPAPADNLAIPAHTAGVTETGADGGERSRRRIRLAVLIPAPTLDAAVAEHAACMPRSGANRTKLPGRRRGLPFAPGTPTHDRAGLAQRAAVIPPRAERNKRLIGRFGFAVVAATPALDHARMAQRASMVQPRADRDEPLRRCGDVGRRDIHRRGLLQLRLPHDLARLFARWRSVGLAVFVVAPAHDLAAVAQRAAVPAAGAEGDVASGRTGCLAEPVIAPTEDRALLFHLNPGLEQGAVVPVARAQRSKADECLLRRDGLARTVVAPTDDHFVSPQRAGVVPARVHECVVEDRERRRGNIPQ